MKDRMLTLDDVADFLNVSWSQAYALVTSGDLDAVQIGGKRHWRVDPQRLQQWLDDKHAETAARHDRQAAELRTPEAASGRADPLTT